MNKCNIFLSKHSLFYMQRGGKKKRRDRQFPGNLPRPEEREGEFSCVQTKNTLSSNHHSRDVIRQRMKFYNVCLFDFFICSPASAPSTYQFSSLNARETKPAFCGALIAI